MARALVILAAVAGAAHAEAAFVWQAPSGCPNVAEVRARIERRLGEPLAARGVAVAIALEDQRYVARIDLGAITAEHEARVLTSAACDELADAVALVIARTAAEHRAPEVHAAERVEPPGPWGAGMRVQGVSGIGALPRIGLAGELAGFVRHDEVYVEVAATRWMPSPRFFHLGSPGRVDVRLDAAALRVGYQSRRLPLRGWIAGEAGVVEGDGVAIHDPEMDQRTWAALGAGFGVGWAMTRHLRLVGTLETLVPLVRARFALNDGSQVFRADPITVRSGLGLEVGW